MLQPLEIYKTVKPKKFSPSKQYVSYIDDNHNNIIYEYLCSISTILGYMQLTIASYC